MRLLLCPCLPSQLHDSHLLNEISGCLEASGPMELTLLAVALMPFDRLEALVDGVVDGAKRNVRSKVRSNQIQAAVVVNPQLE